MLVTAIWYVKILRQKGEGSFLHIPEWKIKGNFLLFALAVMRVVFYKTLFEAWTPEKAT